MRRFLIPLLVLVALAIPTSAWEASTSANLSIGVTQSQAISNVALSGSSFAGGAGSGTIVGPIMVTMTPTAPPFSGTLSLSGTNASSFQLVGSNLETNGILPAGAYQINLVATQPGATGSPFTQPETITGTTATASTCPANDGSSGAPAGTPQLPNLLKGYVSTLHVLGCKVAGVDYYVGVPNGTTLKDPSAPGALPAGVSISGQNIIVSASNVTLSGFDFSLHNSYGIYIEPGVSGTNITDSNFLCDSKTIPVNIAAGALNTSITYNTIDGGGTSGDLSFGELIYNQGSGLIVEYNWIKNAPQHFVTEGGGGALTYDYNLLENGGWGAGQHLNYLQFGGGTYSSAQVNFNTMVQDKTLAGGEGFQMYLNGSGSISNGDIGYNTLITIPSGSTLAESWILHAGSNSQYPASATGTVHDNYIDARGAYGPFYGGLTGFTYSNNINLVTGAHF